MLYTVSLFLLFTFNHGDLVAAGPAADHQGTSEQDDWCDDPSTIHKRLDTVQEQLEKTVEHLDSEVKSLLNDVSETAWTKPLAPGTPLVDLFEDPS
ncbi:placenta-specific protein 9 isoform X2 [Crotalus tigris]|uniref:placenta-specific protein 9 isoform X2 n=1 Tax=Crotalus tigris TaxID=88082 RepID=UPI00192F98FA|nr:placenta-specific protein 9 isoform X2 [Crotalus tigris]